MYGGSQMHHSPGAESGDVAAERRNPIAICGSQIADSVPVGTGRPSRRSHIGKEGIDLGGQVLCLL
jgi:hypothetical protein